MEYAIACLIFFTLGPIGWNIVYLLTWASGLMLAYLLLITG